MAYLRVDLKLVLVYNEINSANVSDKSAPELESLYCCCFCQVELNKYISYAKRSVETLRKKMKVMNNAPLYFPSINCRRFMQDNITDRSFLRCPAVIKFSI